MELKRLRDLRQRAQKLLKSLDSDLSAFQATNPETGFLRLPTSGENPNDVNVTTTCSCLMALALGARTKTFYPNPSLTPKNVLERIVGAAWMSSGLSENNAFTTTLVLRTLGFLVENGDVEDRLVATLVKSWEPELRLKPNTLPSLADKLLHGRNSLAVVMLPLMSTEAVALLSDLSDAAYSGETVRKDISRVVRSCVLYDAGRIPLADLSSRTRELLRVRHQYSDQQINRSLLDDYFSDEVEPLKEFTLDAIASQLATDASIFRINEYAPSPVLFYWFVDAVEHCKISLSAESWSKLCRWAAGEFFRQQSRVVAQNAAIMDPIAMAMAACLCHRLASVSRKGKLGADAKRLSELPSEQELEKAVVRLFSEQTPSGIWPKYFPLFHYQEAGSNFCFTFELLEAVLAEFGSQRRLLDQEVVVAGLDRAVLWCEQNRLTYMKVSPNTKEFRGWNSGGSLKSLTEEQPESWATAVVHMFLWELVESLSMLIERIVLEKYDAVAPGKRSLESLLDVEVVLEGTPRILKQVISEHLIDPHAGLTRRQLLTRTNKPAVSALLFGPPGTSKTQVARAIAAELQWPLVQIDPSHFLTSTFQNVYVQASEVFEDVSDLCQAVVLFDEMDALMQERGGSVEIDTEGKFLTTFMLPKLVKLHDQRRVVFLMATNFQEQYDSAIKRAGRFDLLLCMGPPTFDAKCRMIHMFYAGAPETNETRDAGSQLGMVATPRSRTREQLSLYTFGEFKSLLERISPDPQLLGRELAKLTAPEFEQLVKEDARTVTLKRDDANVVLSYLHLNTLEDLDSSGVSLDAIDNAGKPNTMTRYIKDRKQSRIQVS